jgi:REP element-mobilizing transposase RayT
MRRKVQDFQLHFPGLAEKTKSYAHGGDENKGRRKVARPFDPKQALHVVLRSSKARGNLSMLHPRHCNHIKALLERLQERRNVRVYRYSNVGNHLHLLIRARSRSDWQGFIREFAGGVAMIVTGARKGAALERLKSAGNSARGFWDGLTYSRIVRWGRDFTHVSRYVCKNLWEAVGVPVRKLLARGFRCLEISEDGVVLVLVSEAAGREMLADAAPD